MSAVYVFYQVSVNWGGLRQKSIQREISGVVVYLIILVIFSDVCWHASQWT